MMSADSDAKRGLRDEIGALGEMLGNTIEEIAGTESFDTVEQIRRLSRDRRYGDKAADQKLGDRLASLDQDQLRVVIRAFTIFLDLANMAEDRERVRVLRERSRNSGAGGRSESIEEALRKLRDSGKAAGEIQSLLDALQVELVFTAHPTEARRKSVRAKLSKIRDLLDAAQDGLLPAEFARNQHMIRAEMMKLWLTDFIRPWRPTVLQEVRRGLSIKPVLWEVAPQVIREIRTAVAQLYPHGEFHVRPCVTFGSWIGGDRDGHPFVTASVTEQTLLWLRQAALEFHLGVCRELAESLSLSKRQLPLDDALENHLAESTQRWPQLQDQLNEIPPNEIVRRSLLVVLWRLQQTQRVSLEVHAVSGAYSSAGELLADVELLHSALDAARGGHLLVDEIAQWMDRIRTFGFHLARLDVRQDSRRYVEVIDELLASAGHNPPTGSESNRQAMLARISPGELDCDLTKLSDDCRDTLALFQLLRRVVAVWGTEGLGCHVVSMTHQPSDLLSVLWLWEYVHHMAGVGDADHAAPLPIVPLFETIDDLERAPQILENLWKVPAYRDDLRRQHDRQTVMLGYSDSTKDGGYLSACWSLFQAQQQVDKLASREGIQVTFFHGRGGSLGRGGGPAARGILSLPPETFHGSLRLTEQGEVLADRYDDSRIAHRHLEQLVWSSLLASGLPASPVPAPWQQMMQELAAASLRSYRELVEQPGFVDYFRRATPVGEIEQLPIGSRPARRRGGHGLSDLRAIPWVFSWTQSRCLLPAWYGLGAAIEPLLDDPQHVESLQAMYRQWPFFRATIDNTELALAKTDLGIAERYADLANDSEMLQRVGTMIATEFSRARQAVLAITGQAELLDGTPWLQESIRVRNHYIDPLNMIQVELLRRLQQSDSQQPGEDVEELRHLMRLTINGLAAGMRTSG